MSSKIVLTAAALVLFLSGAALLFAPVEIVPAAPLLAQLLAAALLGLAAANWTARSSAAGGIYGRAVVFGNLTAFSISALVSIRAYAQDRAPAVLAIAIVTAILAAAFARLLFGGAKMQGAP